MDYRANQGLSSYNAFTATLHWRHHNTEARLNYTWSHAIDDQSDPLQGLLASNLEVTNVAGGAISPRPAAFTEEYSNSADRGNADFDQRQSLTGFASWITSADHSSPAWSPWIRNWTLSALGVLRSGTPYSIHLSDTDYPFFYNRPNLISTQIEFAGAGRVPTGRELLNPSAFSESGPKLGNVGRNALVGPGFYDLDLSVAREFSIRRGEHPVRLQIRADAYNVLNHANLANPNVIDNSAFLGAPNFGVAPYGRPAESGGPLSFLPVAESSRQIQLMLRAQF